MPRSTLSSALLSALLASPWLGCGPATRSDPSFWTPHDGVEAPPAVDPADAGAGDSGAGGSVDPPPARGVAFRFTTVSVGGEYAPKNVGAVWITDTQDVFVKTLEVWAAKRAKHLVKWRAASGDNVIDAVTGATRSSHGPHEALWDGTDTAGQRAPDGAYRLYAEHTESNSASGEPPGPWIIVDFTVGPAAEERDATDQAGFTSIHLSYQP